MTRRLVRCIPDGFWRVESYMVACSAVLLAAGSLPLFWWAGDLWPRFLDAFLVVITVCVAHISRRCGFLTLLASLVPAAYFLPPANSLAVDVTWRTVVMLAFYVVSAMLVIALVPSVGDASRTAMYATELAGGATVIRTALGIAYFAAATGAMFWLTSRGLRPIRFMDVYLAGVLCGTVYVSRSFGTTMYFASLLPAAYCTLPGHPWAADPGYNVNRILSYSCVAMVMIVSLRWRASGGEKRLVMPIVAGDQFLS